MNKMISSLLSLSTLALVSAAPLTANALPIRIQVQSETLIAGRDNDRPDRDHYYYVYCHKNHRRETFGPYNRRSEARHAKHAYEDRGYYCYISSHR